MMNMRRGFQLVFYYLFQVLCILSHLDAVQEDKEDSAMKEWTTLPSLAPSRRVRDGNIVHSHDSSNNQSNTPENKWREFVLQWFGLVVLIVAFIAFLLFHYKHLILYYCCGQGREFEENVHSSSVTNQRTQMIRLTVRERSQILGQIFPKTIRWQPEKKKEQRRITSKDLPSDAPEDRMVCSICLVSFIRNVYVLKGTTCQHMFHYSCCMEWLAKHDECPYCRQEFFTTIEWRTAAIQVLGEARTQALEMARDDPP